MLFIQSEQGRSEAARKAEPDRATSGSVRSVRERGLCNGCGICAANCPRNCIEMAREGFEVVPRVDEAACVRCGLCLKACPSGQLNAYAPGTDLARYLLGECREILCVQAKDRELLANSNSGGLVTQMVRALLESGDYGAAFLVGGYDYREPLATRRFAASDDFASTPGSRYLTVSHEFAARYMIEHPDARVILVATPCAARGLRNTIALHKLDPERYLIIGLFCDKTMHYGVVRYFAGHPQGRGRELRGLRFRTKRIAGWPGDVRLEYADGSLLDLPRSERMRVKDYFMPERCLYCLDKLNLSCDIAVGDNYIQANADKLGANSCILRTERGEAAWNRCRQLFHCHEDAAEDLIRSQKLSGKIQNYYNACLKGIYSADALDERAVRAYRNALSKLKVGRSANCYRAIQWDLRRRSMKNLLRRAARKLKIRRAR